MEIRDEDILRRPNQGIEEEEEVIETPTDTPETDTDGLETRLPEEVPEEKQELDPNLMPESGGLEHQTTDGEVDEGKPLTSPVDRAIHNIPVLGAIDQGLDAAAQGVGDFAFDAAGLAGKTFGIPLLEKADMWWDKHNPKSDDPVHTLIRDASAIIIPTLVGGKLIVGGLRGLTAARNIPTAQRTLGSILAYAGVDTTVAAISSQSYEQDNMIGALNSWLGWNLPGCTVEGMDPDKRRHLHMYEAAVFSVGVDTLLAVGSFWKNVRRVNMDQKAIAIAEKQVEELRKLIPADQADPVTDSVQGWRAARDVAVKNETIERLAKGTKQEPYDAFVNQPARLEQRAVSPDSIKADILGFKEDIYRIQNNKGTIDGVPRPAVKREVINNIFEAGMTKRAKSLANLYEKGLSARFDLKIKDEIIPNSELDKAIDKLTDAVFNPDLNFKAFQRLVTEGKTYVFQGRKVLGDDAWVAASYAWKNVFDNVLNPNNMKASAALTTQAGSEIATTARAMNLLDGIATNSRQWEMMSEKMKFLVGEVAANQEIGRRALEMKKLIDAKDSKAVRTWLETSAENFDETLLLRKNKAGAVIDEIQRIATDNPHYLRAFQEAYEATNGDVDTLYKLHRFAEESLGVLKKGIYDRNPEVPSLIIQGLNSLRYNNVLNGLAPIRAVATNTILSTVKPITVFAGAMATGDVGTFKRALYTYGGVIENLKRGFKVIGEDWRLANSNPEVAVRRGRADFKVTNLDKFQMMETLAEAWRRDASLGRADRAGKLAVWNMAKAVSFWANTKFNRWGVNSLYALDGMLKSFSASGASRARAYDSLFASTNGAFNKKAFDDLQRSLYNEAFDSTGKLIAKDAKFAADEFALNLDSNIVSKLEYLMDHVPAAKALFMFPRTGVNALELSWSFNPVSNLGPAITRARRALSATSAGEIAEVMAEHGLENTIPAYKALQSEYIGRQIMGSTVVMGAGMWALEGNLTGNGPQDPAERNRMRAMGWQPRSVKNPITGQWHSYEGFEPFESILSMVGDVVYHANRVDQAVTEDWFNKIVMAITMNTTNDTFASGFQPLVSLYSGDEGAWARYTANQINMLIPGTSLRTILNNAMGGGLRDVKNDFQHYLANNWRFMIHDNPELPNMVDVYTGKPIKFHENVFTNAANAILPFFKQNGGMEPWRQWLLSTGWDGLHETRKNVITGGKLTEFDRQWINNWIGKNGNLIPQIEKLMNHPDRYYTKEIQRYKKALGNKKQTDFSIKKTLVHRELTRIHNQAIKLATLHLERWYAAQGEDLVLDRYARSRVDQRLGTGDPEGAAQLHELIKY